MKILKRLKVIIVVVMLILSLLAFIVTFMNNYNQTQLSNLETKVNAYLSEKSFKDYKLKSELTHLSGDKKYKVCVDLKEDKKLYCYNSDSGSSKIKLFEIKDDDNIYKSPKEVKNKLIGG